MKILRFSVNPRDRQTGEDVLLNPGFGEKLTKKKVRDLLEEKPLVPLRLAIRKEKNRQGNFWNG